ncbi:MAG TPA: histidine kinase [Actinomycetaceae bacterium]|nr:histidine kinase [Actinomycetaceae bacterium]
MTTALDGSGSAASSAPPGRPTTDERPRRLVTDFVPGLANLMVSALLFFVWGIPILVLLAVGVGLVPAFGIGLLLLWALLYLIRAVLSGERSRSRAIYNLPVRDFAAPQHPPDAGWLGRTLAPFATQEFWRSLMHHVLKLLLGIVATSMAIWLLGTGLGTFGMIGSEAVGYRFFPGLTVSDTWAIPLGILFVLFAAAVLWVGVLADRMLDSTLLASSEEELRQEVHALTDARDSAERAAEAERRRIERDLHDGAQPRLVNLAMTLGMAKSKMDSDPESARQMIDEAHGEAKAAVNDLRQLARGIHPAVLTDRGLDAALSALAARSPVPVRVRVELNERPARAAESVAYFVVAEALTNVAKHSRANRADVVVTRDGDVLRIVVMDDGVGGARVANGTQHTGLAGLVERVRSARGTLSLISPSGGPTILTVEIPCV